ncbi:eight-cysteine-cluster domain-containing protein [Candidatus Woesearchaeota archaeon]|nr:eight-cysteine-cluster domain-containing protein [Candidatus Woesearchaeota archaeon]
MKTLLLLVALAVVAAGCQAEEAEEATDVPDDEVQVENECTSDADCASAGCSGQLCVPKNEEGIITTCEYREEYSCLEFTSCGCIEGSCAWANTDEYAACLEQYSGE